MAEGGAEGEHRSGSQEMIWRYTHGTSGGGTSMISLR